jgi:hypothetical protein
MGSIKEKKKDPWTLDDTVEIIANVVWLGAIIYIIYIIN